MKRQAAFDDHLQSFPSSSAWGRENSSTETRAYQTLIGLKQSPRQGETEEERKVILEVWSFQFIFDVSCHVTAVWDFISIDRRESKAIRVITSVSLSVTSFPQSGVSVSERPGMVQKRNLSRRSEERRVGKECRSRCAPYH